MKYSVTSWFCIIILFGCVHKKTEFPSHFPPPTDSIIQINSKKAELGKLLFFDPALSKNNKISCASCHQPSLAFADSLPFSMGASGKRTFRNTPSLTNLSWRTSFFLDGGVPSLEQQAIAPMVSHEEMDESFSCIIEKLNSKQGYKDKFKKVFGSDSITGIKIIYALAEYERTIVSANSAYDNYLAGKQQLTPLQKKGLSIFERKCALCHAGVLFTDNNFHNTGLDSTFPSMENVEDPMLGRARITRKATDIGKYRTPSLRNLTLTAPYMHDGRFSTIQEVLNHYSVGVIKSSYTDSLILNNGTTGITLTENEKDALISFLQTLTDTTFIETGIFNKK